MTASLFLSHAGSDGDAARILAQRLRNTPAARSGALEVWLDLDRLDPGRPWQPQLETALNEATCGAILVGSRGIANWVQAEFEVLNSRAIGDKSFRLIPILLGGANSADLSPFAKRYHAVRDPLNDDNELARLVAAILGEDGDAGRAALTVDPFPGLHAMDESWNDRFFGRNDEIADLLARLRQEPVVSIVADSGAGKSSLAMAGLGASWRGGAFGTRQPLSQEPVFWNVVTMRPRSDPLDGLRSGITEAAEALGLDIQTRAALRQQANLEDPSEGLYALECGLPVGRVKTLLIIDQAEELVTATRDRDRRQSFGRFIAEMAERGRADDRLRVVLTVRADYAKLVSGVEGLGAHLRRETACLRLAAPCGEDLRAIVEGPLHLARFPDEDQIVRLAAQVEIDLSDRASDVALAQMALHLVWRERSRHGNNLLAAYGDLGRVWGALGQEAERVVEEELSVADHAALMPIFLRLLRLGDTAGATRRVALKSEFTEVQRDLIDRLAGERCGRLLQTTQDTVEIAHESLLIQWPELHQYVLDNERDIRSLGRLITAADRWYAAGKNRGHLGKRVEVQEYDSVATAHGSWLSEDEAAFLSRSRFVLGLARFAVFAAACIIAGLAGLGAFYYDQGLKSKALAEASEKRAAEWARRATAAEARAKILESQAATDRTAAEAAEEAAAAEREAAENARRTAMVVLARARADADPASALKLVLSAWPKKEPPSEGMLENARLALAMALNQTRPSVALIGHDGPVQSAEFSPDGRRIVSAANDGTLRIWDAVDGAEITTLRGHELFVFSAKFSPDGRRIVSAGLDGTVRIWDATTGAEIATIRSQKRSLNSAEFGPDSRRIVSGGRDGTVSIWDAATGAEIGTLYGHDGSVSSAGFSPDGRRIVSGAEDGTVRIWDASTRTEIATLRGHEHSVASAEFSPDGRSIVSASIDSTVRIWDAATGAEIATLRGHENWVQSAAFSPDSRRIVSGSDDGTVRLWDASTGVEIAILRGHAGTVSSARFSLDGRRIVSGGHDGTVRIWDAATGAVIATFRDLEGWVQSAGFSPDGRRIVSGDDETVRIWDTATGAEIATLRGHEQVVFSASFSPDGRRIVSGGQDGTVRVWDAATKTEIATLRGHAREVFCAGFSPDGRHIVSAGIDGTVRIWDATTEAEIATFHGHESSVASAAFSHDGRRIVSAGIDGTVRIWDTATGVEIATLLGHDGGVLSAEYSLDGGRIVSGGRDGTVRVWDTATGAEIATLRGHADMVRSAGFSPDGYYIVSGGNDGTVRLWDAATGTEIATLLGHKGWVFSAEFSHDGSHVVSGGTDGTVRIWDAFTIPGNALQIACQFLPIIDGQRDLSVAEIAAEIGLPDPEPLEPCETYDPPMPDLAGLAQQ